MASTLLHKLNFDAFAEITNNWWVSWITANQWLTVTWWFLVAASSWNDDWWYIRKTWLTNFLVKTRMYLDEEQWWNLQILLQYNNTDNIYFTLNIYWAWGSYNYPCQLSKTISSVWTNDIIYNWTMPAAYYKFEIQNLNWAWSIKMFTDADVLIREMTITTAWVVDFFQISKHKWFDYENWQKVDYVELYSLTPDWTSNFFNFF